MKVLSFCSLSLILCLSACQSVPKASQTQTTVVADAREQLPVDLAELKSNTAQQHQPKIALVLGSGGARGYAHIGIIEVLEQNGIRPDLIVGTSAGSIVGALYASGKDSAKLKQIALNLKTADVREITFDRKGFFDGKKVEDFMNEQVENKPLEQLEIPMYVVATELKNGHQVVFNYGNTGQAVRASISIPTMFVPTQIQQKEYVDGGLVSPVPVKVAKQLGADIIIAVNILAQPDDTPTDSLWGLFNQNINIMQNQLADNELKDADIVIQPELREKGHIFDLKERENTIVAGEKAAQLKLSQIQEVIQRKTELAKAASLSPESL